MDDVAEVKQKTDMVAVIGEHVKLTRAGRNFKGLCPFHEEKSPSFMVSPELQIYKCFGCSKAGDVFTFLQEYEGMEFYEVLKYLADKLGIKVTPRRGQETSIKAQIIEANALAAKFYHYILTKHPLGKPGLTYLTQKRGLNPETIDEFQLGFAPQNRSLLFEALSKKKKIKSDILVKAGLVFRARAGYMDRFRERVVFPITDPRGEVVALAGRILPEYDTGKVGKYINSPETPVYHKSDSLFGMSHTKDKIRSTRTVVVVEGELDFLSPWQSGIENIVAIKGTALTESHVRILSRFADTLIMALDSDFAGDAAAIRGLLIAQNAGLEVKVASMGKYKDPDEFARADPEGFKSAVRNAIDAWEFVINVATKRFDLTTGAGKAKASRQLIPILSSIEDSIVRSHYVQKTASKLGVPMEAVAREVDKRASTPEQTKDSAPEKEGKSRREILEERFLVLALDEPELLAEEAPDVLLTSPLNIRLAREIAKFALNRGSLDISELGEGLPAELKEGVAALVMQSSVEVKDVSHEGKLVRQELKELVLKEKLSALSAKISELEGKGDEEGLVETEKEFQLFSRRLGESTRES